MSWFPSADRAAPIATSMVVDGPGTIGLHPLGPKQRGGRPAPAFLLRDAKPKAAEKSWRRTLQVQDRGDIFVAGLRSDQTNRGRTWERLEKTVRGNLDVATTIGLALSRFAPRTVAAAPSGTDLNLNVKTMMSSQRSRHRQRTTSHHVPLLAPPSSMQHGKKRPDGRADNHPSSRCGDPLADTMRVSRDELLRARISLDPVAARGRLTPAMAKH
ncbi:hypothetical protein ACTG4Q_11505 [Bradyrhizobium denitrificans]